MLKQKCASAVEGNHLTKKGSVSMIGRKEKGKGPLDEAQGRLDRLKKKPRSEREKLDDDALRKEIENRRKDSKGGGGN